MKRTPKLRALPQIHHLRGVRGPKKALPPVQSLYRGMRLLGAITKQGRVQRRRFNSRNYSCSARGVERNLLFFGRGQCGDSYRIFPFRIEEEVQKPMNL